MAPPATEEDTRPKVPIRVEWCQVLESYPRNASGYVERDQQFINEPTLWLKGHLDWACERNNGPSAKPKSSNSKTNLIYKRAFCNYL